METDKDETKRNSSRTKVAVAVGCVFVIGLFAWFNRSRPTSSLVQNGVGEFGEAVLFSSDEDSQQYQAAAANDLADGVAVSLAGLQFSLIPPGEYVTDAVTLRAPGPFYMSTTEVTVGVLRRFTESQNYETESDRNGMGGYGFVSGRWGRAPDYGWRNLGDIIMTDDLPAAGVSWNDATDFCKWASAETGRTIRLPTNVEWEYASRCLRPGEWCFGDDESLMADFAWTVQNSDGVMHRVTQL